MTRFKLPQRRPRRRELSAADRRAREDAAQAAAIQRLLTALYGPRTQPDEDEEDDR